MNKKSLVALSIALASATSSLAMASAEVVQYLYTADNALTTNSLYGYKVSTDGTLQSLPNSPFATGGAGDGIATFGQDGIITSPDGRFLFVVNTGSNDISVFRTRKNGSLTPVPGSPFSSGGIFPISLALSDDILYVAHAGPNAPTATGSDVDCLGCDYRGFRVSGNGSLEPIEGSLIELSTNPAAFPLAIRFNPEGTVLFGSRFVFAPFQIESEELLTYQLDKETGLLTPAPGSPYQTREGSNQPIGYTFNPANSSQIFVANSVADVPESQGNLSTFIMAETGQIAEINGSPTSANLSDDEAIATCWVAATSDGSFLYATNTGTDNLSIFSATDGGLTTLLDVVPVPPFDDVNDSPVDVLVSPDDKYVYALQTLVGSIAGWKIAEDGSLSLLPGQPVSLPEEAQPFGLVIVEKEARKRKYK